MADIELDSLVVRDFTKVSSEVFKQAVESGEIGENDINLTAYCPPSLWLFYSHWSDHEIDDMSWLCANTFSWHPSDPYIAGYEKLVNAITGAEQKTDTIGDITITYYQKGDNGLKVCMPDQESNLVALYEATGVAWYYILDTVNKQFKLPRTKYGFTGLRDSVGGYVAPGLPNITGEVGQIDFSGSRSFSGAFTDVASPSGDTGATHAGGTRTTVGFDASLSNPTYQDGATVQPPATQMYLYFYVGNFEQDAVEQTAGLNAELFNNKADRNLLNTTDNVDIVIESQLPTADNGYTWYRKYKSGWVEQGGLESVTGHSSSTTSNITLPIPMTDTNYTAYATINHSGETVGVACQVNKTSATNISLRIAYKENLTRKISWMVVGTAA